MITLKNKAYVISDLHGNINALLHLLQYWHEEEEQLVFIGDYMDRGNCSLEVIQTVQKLVETKKAICLMGNHEVIFLKWLEDPERITDSFIAPHVGGLQTIDSFLATAKEKKKDLKTPKKIAAYIKNTFQKEIQFVNNLPLYYEFGFYIIVHAGIDPLLDTLTEMSPKHFLWIRDEFYNTPHKLNKTVVFGHTPTQNMGNENGDVWISPCKKKIAIDGGGFLPNGCVNGVKLSLEDDSITIYQYRKIPR